MTGNIACEQFTISLSVSTLNSSDKFKRFKLDKFKELLGFRNVEK
jgi:hypothetical protein